MNERSKTCGKCRKRYRKAAGSGIRAFDPHRSRPDGLQPFCRACDFDAKQKPHRGWTRLLADKRGVLIEISEFEYREIIACGTCYWCKGNVFRWGGYWIDRVDNQKNYERGNMAPCCRWCNQYKSDLPEELFREMIDSLIRRFGIGSGNSRWFNWELYGNKYKSKRPDLSRLEIKESTLDLFAQSLEDSHVLR